MQISEDSNAYIERIRPLLSEIYRRAHVISGNAVEAERIAQNVIADAYLIHREARGKALFREGINDLTRTISLEELAALKKAGGYERDSEEGLDRSLYRPDQGAQSVVLEALCARVVREKPAMRRILMLKYGCGLTISQISAVMEMHAGDVREKCRLCLARLMRGLPGLPSADRMKSLEAELTKLSLDALRRSGPDIPEMSTAFTLFSENMGERRNSRGVVRRGVKVALIVMGALICALVFWIVAVLLEPETTSAIPPSAAQFDEMAKMDEDIVIAAIGNTFFI